MPAEAEPSEVQEPTLQEQLKKEGNQFFASGDYVKAVAAYNKAIKADPENGVLYSNRAAAFINLGKEIKAIKDAEQAITLKPDWAKGYFRKGAALVALRRWDDAVESLTKAAEIEPKSKEILTMLREATRKRAAEKRSESGQGSKLAGGFLDNNKGLSGPTSDTNSMSLGVSEGVIEKFVQQSLTSAITQFANNGELKSIVYMQPSGEGKEMSLVGIEKGFEGPEANQQCCEFLRKHAADNNAAAMLTMAEKRNIAYPQVWKEKSKSKWKWGEKQQGIFVQMDALTATGTAERKVWFVPTGTGAGGKPEAPVEIDSDQFSIMPPLLR